MLSFMISRPCRELARPAASICPKGEPARSSLSLPASSSRACTQRQAWPSKCGGLTREARNVHKRSATIATAITEQAIIGSMIQPPDLISSHTARSLFLKNKRNSTTTAARTEQVYVSILPGCTAGRRPHHRRTLLAAANYNFLPHLHVLI